MPILISKSSSRHEMAKQKESKEQFFQDIPPLPNAPKKKGRRKPKH